MIPQRILQIIILTLCALLSAGCGRKKAADEIDFGTLTGTAYSNNYFGLTIKVPSDWSIQDQETRNRIVETGTSMMAGEDKAMKAALKASEMQSVHMFAAFQHPLGAPVEFNPSIMCVAENVRSLPGLKTGKDYHFHARKLLESGAVKFTFPKELTTEKLGGIDFDVMHSSMSIGGLTVNQKYYATILKGYALVIIVSFNTPEQESALQSILDSATVSP